MKCEPQQAALALANKSGNGTPGDTNEGDIEMDGSITRSPLHCTLIVLITVIAILVQPALGADPGLPPPWVGQDIGSVSAAGGAGIRGGSQFTLFSKAQSADIGGAADAFHYVYMPLAGDCQIVAHVAGIYTPLSRTGWVATSTGSRPGYSEPAAIDGNLSSNWQAWDPNQPPPTNGPDLRAMKEVGQYFQVDMGSAYAIGAVNLQQGPGTQYQVPGVFDIDVSTDAVHWTVAGRGPAYNVTNQTFVTFPSVTARYVRVTTTNVAFGGWWAINEFNVYSTAIPAAAKAGVMIRQSLAPNSAFAATLLTAGQGASMTVRASSGATAATVSSANVSAPYWVKLARTGNVIQSSVSSDGATWTSMGSVSVSMTDPVTIGIASSSDSAGQMSTAGIDSWQVSPETARAADAFVDSIGTNVHLNNYGSYSTINTALLGSGIRHIRDGDVPGEASAVIGEWQYLAQNGIRLDLLNGCALGYESNVTTSQFFNDVINIGPSNLDSIEYCNEPDANKGAQPNWISTLTAYCQQVHDTFKADPRTANIPIVGTSPTDFLDPAALGSAYNMGAITDYNNVHPYTYEQHPWEQATPGGYGLLGDGPTIDGALAQWSAMAPGKPFFVTEEGYFTGTDTNSVSPAVHGKYIPRIYLENFLRGVTRTYQYDFIDDGTNTGYSENNYGQAYNNGSAKPALTCTQNMISLLKEPGANFTPGGLSYSLSGSPANVHHLLLEKSNGVFYLVLWCEIVSSDANATQPVTVTFNQPISQADVYQPSIQTAAVGSYSNPSQLTLNVPDSPMIVQIIPGASQGLLPDGDYYLANACSGLVLDVPNMSSNSGVQLWQWPVNGTGAQIWRFKNLGGGLYQITNQHSGDALDVSNMSTQSGAVVQQWTPNSTQAQVWYLMQQQNGCLSVINEHSNMALDIAGGSTQGGALTQQTTYNPASASQLWNVGPLNGAYRIVSPYSGRALTVSGGAVGTGTPVVVYDYAATPWQQWNLTAVGNGYYEVIDSNSGEALTDAGPVTAATTIAPYTGTGAELWLLQPLGNGHYKFVQQNSGWALDENGAGNGGKVDVWDWNGGPWQEWTLSAP